MSNDRTPLLSGGPSPDPEESSALSRFRLAVGINNTSSTSLPSDLESLRKHSSGIYKAILAQQRRFFLQYHIIETLYYFALLTQLVIGATLASLGPLSKLHPITITVLGIVNSCIAGVLAILKGQGLPDRLRKDEFEMRKVQDFIEECECRLAVGWDDEINAKAVDGLIKEVFDRYSVARDTAEMNRPSSYAHQVDVEPGNAHGNNRVAVGGKLQSRIAVGGRKGKALEIS